MPNLETLYAMEVERRLRLEAEIKDLRKQLWDALAKVATLEKASHGE